MITELNNPETPTAELKTDLAILRSKVNNLKDERDKFSGGSGTSDNVERLRRVVRMESVQDEVNDINEILLYRSKNTEK